MGPRRDLFLAEGVVLIETLGAVRARGRLVRSIGSFEFVRTDKAYFSELTRIVSKALKWLKYASACTAESLPPEPSFGRGTLISEDAPSERQEPKYAVDTHQNRFTRPCSLLFLCLSLNPACV